MLPRDDRSQGWGCESQRSSGPRQHMGFDVCPEQPSPLHKPCSEVPILALMEHRPEAGLAASTHCWLLPSMHTLPQTQPDSPANGAWEAERPRSEPYGTTLSFLQAWLANMIALETSEKADHY